MTTKFSNSKSIFLILASELTSFFCFFSGHTNNKKPPAPDPIILLTAPLFIPVFINLSIFLLETLFESFLNFPTFI